MAVADLKVLVASVDGLAGRVAGALELTELIKQKALPQAPKYAFVIPAGIRPRSEGDAGAGAFLQSVDEVFSIVLVVKSAGDVTGAKVQPELDTLIWAVIDAVLGQAEDEAIGVYRLVSGGMVSLLTGAAFYQLDVAIQKQLRTLA